MALLKSTRHKELKPEDLKLSYIPESFEFDSIESIEPIEGIVGQERAIKALKIGVDIKSPGYNIFITGLSGTGKLTTIKNMLETISPDCPELNDYAYVNNFRDEDRPMLLEFPAGKGKVFKKDLGNAIKFLQENIPLVLENDPFISKKKKMLADYGNSQQTLTQGFEEKLRKDNLTLGQVKVGEFSRPEILAVIENQPVMIQQLDEYIRNGKITKEESQQIMQKYAAYQEELQSLFKESLKLSQVFQEKILQSEKDAVADVVKVSIGELQNNYEIPKVIMYLDFVMENILQNLDVFKGQKPVREQTEDGAVIDYLKEYEVNIILDNSLTKQCPVIIETSPSFSNLFGLIEKYSDGSGGWYADFTRIKAGSLLRANNGYLVINAMDAFSETSVWKTLKRVLLYGQLEIQDISNMYQFSPSILKPEPIPINTKIIMIGSDYIYSVLSGSEEDFNKIFKIKADFDYEMKRTENTIVEYTRVIKKIVTQENLMDFDRTAMAKLLEYASRYAGEKNKLTTRFAYIADIARESSFWAVDVGDKIVTAYHVQQAYDSARERHGLHESKVTEMINDGTIIIDTEGSRIGQINGLAVYSSGFHSFGKPTRITASVSLGNGNIINVEREAGLSGNTHNKGVLIITGYFRENFGKKTPLSFTASLVFEQGYGMIDGDSASITEICALLSTIAEVPIKQSFAITGSVNQKGDIQPIGGVNEKIEGFFDICNERGLTGKNGVIIPHQNVKDLMLKDDLIKAVEEKKFHIYPVARVEEAAEILMGVKAGKLLKSGSYEANTLFGTVEKKLKEMRRKIKPASANTKTATKSKAKKSTRKK